MGFMLHLHSSNVAVASDAATEHPAALLPLARRPRCPSPETKEEVSSDLVKQVVRATKLELHAPLRWIAADRPSPGRLA